MAQREEGSRLHADGAGLAGFPQPVRGAAGAGQPEWQADGREPGQVGIVARSVARLPAVIKREPPARRRVVAAGQRPLDDKPVWADLGITCLLYTSPSPRD